MFVMLLIILVKEYVHSALEYQLLYSIEFMMKNKAFLELIHTWKIFYIEKHQYLSTLG